MPSDSFSRWVEAVVSICFYLFFLLFCCRVQANQCRFWFLLGWTRTIPSLNQRTELVTVCWAHRQVQHRTVHVNDTTATVQTGKSNLCGSNFFLPRCLQFFIEWPKLFEFVTLSSYKLSFFPYIFAWRAFLLKRIVAHMRYETSAINDSIKVVFTIFGWCDYCLVAVRRRYFLRSAFQCNKEMPNSDKWMHISVKSQWDSTTLNNFFLTRFSPSTQMDANDIDTYD